MAAVTTRPTIGVLVSSATFRNPGLVAKMAVTLDHISGGRAILGLGSGYYELEHRAYGLEFGDVRERMDRLEEATMLIRRLLDGETVDHDGRFYRMEGMLIRPRPVQSRLPIIIGGMGRNRLMRIVARYADMWNAFGTLEEISDAPRVWTSIARGPAATRIHRAHDHPPCGRQGRHGGASEAWRAISDRHMPSPINPEWLQVGGSPADVADAFRAHEAAGFTHAIWVFRDPYDLETMERLGEVRRMTA